MGIIRITGINKGRAGSVTGPQHRHPSDGRERRYGDLPTAPQALVRNRTNCPTYAPQLHPPTPVHPPTRATNLAGSRLADSDYRTAAPKIVFTS